jgi:hypothetical protein
MFKRSRGTLLLSPYCSHSAGLDCGRVPLDVLDGVIDRYIAQARAA